jgi:hypothetical protein
MAIKKDEASVRVTIPAPDMRLAQFRFIGSEPLACCRFGAKARDRMIMDQKAGRSAKSKKILDPKDFEALFREAQYRSDEGWCGIHAACLRCAAISACRIVGFKMTLAKLGLFVLADGRDREDGTPLLRVYGPEPDMWIGVVRNANGMPDMRPRPRWKAGQWELRPRIRYDAGMFSVSDVSNLMLRVGLQVGIGEGRPDSRNSAGLGYGLFDIAGAEGTLEQAA